MITRSTWVKMVESAWQERSVVWLSGVRRAGKTCLCHTLEGVEYLDCELPRTRRILDDPEAFLAGHKGGRVVLDEVHRLSEPSQLLKIAADHFPDVRILATGSSTLAATAKFKDTLAGRKRDVWLTPMMSNDLQDFGNDDLEYRLLRGGLPPFFLAAGFPERDFQEWMDAFWAKDIQELFRLERRSAFQRFVELVLAQSGGIFEATRFAGPCEVSRTTISNYLGVLEATYVAHVIRPFSSRKSTEIVSAPKVYGFDTGFVSYYRGWDSLRAEDRGVLWEHYVLNELHARLQTRRIQYWRSKRGHEIDFVFVERGCNPIAMECKWSADDFDPSNLVSFRSLHPQGENYVAAADVERRFSRRYRDLDVHFVNTEQLIERLQRP